MMFVRRSKTNSFRKDVCRVRDFFYHWAKHDWVATDWKSFYTFQLCMKLNLKHKIGFIWNVVRALLSLMRSFEKNSLNYHTKRFFILLIMFVVDWLTLLTILEKGFVVLRSHILRRNERNIRHKMWISLVNSKGHETKRRMRTINTSWIK